MESNFVLFEESQYLSSRGRVSKLMVEIEGKKYMSQYCHYQDTPKELVVATLKNEMMKTVMHELFK